MSDTMGLDIMAGIGVKLGSLTDELEATRKARLQGIPIDYRRANNAIIATPTVPTAIGLGGPSPGRTWLVRRLVIGGVTFGTTAAGSAEVYAVALPGALVAANRDLSALVDQAPSLPNIAFYTNRQIVLVNPETLHIVIVGGTAAQQYIATCQIEDYAIDGDHPDVYAL